MSKYSEQYLADFLDYLAHERKYSARTVRSYQSDLVRFLNFYEKYMGSPLDTFDVIDKPGIRHFLGMEFENGYSSKTVARRLAALKSYFKYLINLEILTRNPAGSIQSPKIKKSLPSYHSESIIDKLMDLPDLSTEKGLRDRAILELFYSTGIRLSELTNLKVGDLDRSNRVLKVVGKGNKERLIPYGKRAEIAIENYRKKCGLGGYTVDNNGPLIMNSKGQRISPRTIQRRVRNYLKMIAESSNLGPHSLRHSFATHLMDRGADIRAVKDLLGHRSLSSTQIYTHLQPEKMKKIYQQAHPHGS